ncbi:MAG: hypothetical protein AB2809_06210, partial [Candidatus Thiodiazotropha sp.]
MDDNQQWTFDWSLILQAAGVLDALLQPTECFIEIVVQGQAARLPILKTNLLVTRPTGPTPQRSN